jgi:hypothetical protein
LYGFSLGLAVRSAAFVSVEAMGFPPCYQGLFLILGVTVFVFLPVTPNVTPTYPPGLQWFSWDDTGQQKTRFPL